MGLNRIPHHSLDYFTENAASLFGRRLLKWRRGARGTDGEDHACSFGKIAGGFRLEDPVFENSGNGISHGRLLLQYRPAADSRG